MTEITEEYRGRWASILITEGIEAKHFTGKHGPCIFCGGRDRARWVIDDEYYWCNNCNPMTPIDLYMRWTGLSFKESCNKIRGEKVNYQKQEARRKPDPMILLKRIHSKLAKVQAGDVVDTYLNSRKITIRPPDVLTGSKMPYYGGGKIAGVYDCMVSRIADVNGKLESYHLVYLTALGEKISNAQAKIIITPIATITGCSVKIPYSGGNPDILGIAEGIETGLAVSMDEGLTVWCGISANGMEKIQIPDSVTTVYIYGDCDESYTGQASAYALAKRLKAKGLQVKVFIPDQVGTDWLDAL